MVGAKVTPLCLARHLPHKGGDRLWHRRVPYKRNMGGESKPISPLVGEMSGRTEGGVTERRPAHMSLPC